MRPQGREGGSRKTSLAGHALGACALTVLIARGARASEPAEAPVVDAVVAERGPEADALVDALENVAARLGLRIRVERRDAVPPGASWSDDVMAGVWIDARAPDRIEIRTTNVRSSASPRTFVRSVAREGSTAVIVDEVAEVVRAALESIRATPPDAAPEASVPALVSSSPPAAEESVGASPMPRRTPGGFGLDLVAFASERAMSARSSPVLGAGAAFDASFGHPPWRPNVWISAEYGSRFDVQSGQVVFDVGAWSLRAMPGVELVALESMQIDLDLGGGVDFFRVAPLVVRGTQAAFGAASHSVDPIVAAQLLVRLRLVSQVRLTLGFGLDDDLATHEVVVPDGRGGEGRDSFTPWTVRPEASLGLCVPLSSGGACTNPR